MLLFLRYILYFFFVGIALCNFPLVAHAQNCLTDDKMQLLFDQNLSYQKTIESSFEKFNRNKTGHARNETKVIPVHIIIVHTPRLNIGEGDNLSEVQIKSQIDILNRDFARLNADSIKTPKEFSVGGMNIAFCLANVDPFGKATNGITRYSTSLNFEMNEVIIKESTGWSRNDYLNIWVVDLGPNKNGFAYIPSLTMLPNEKVDGVVVDYRKFGNLDSSKPFANGRTCVHEVGHYLGLKHIWGEKGCGDDDGIDDTPRQDTANVGCKVHPKLSCNNNGDMFMNYMDNSSDSCVNAFTKQQVAYMNQILEGPRASITRSNRALECVKSQKLNILGVSQIAPRCFNDKSGALEVFVEGGKPPFKYFLNGEVQDSSKFVNLIGGTYKIKVIDALSNVDSANYFLFQPEKITTSIIQRLYSGCSALTDSLRVKVEASGGVVNALGFEYSVGSIMNRDGIFTFREPGLYKIIAKDFRTCTDTLALNVAPKPYLDTIQTALVPPRCVGEVNGVVEVLIPNSRHFYTLNSLESKLGRFGPLPSGLYRLRVTDSLFGCVYSSLINFSETTKITVFAQGTSVPCLLPDTSSIRIFAVGGIPPYQYSLDSNYQASDLFKKVGIGTFIAKARDSRGCVVEAAPIKINQIGGLVVNFTKEDAFCDNSPSGKVILNATGGSGQYNYYSNGFITSNTILNLKPGLYNFAVEDKASRCLQIKDISIGSKPTMKIVIDKIVKNPNNTLQITFYVVGGLPPYLYSLDKGASFKTIPIFDNIPQGNNTIIVFDNIGCKIEVPLFLTNDIDTEIEKINIYPNPFVDEIKVDLENNVPKEGIQVKLFDMKGDMIKLSINQISVDKNSILIQDLANLPQGMYLLNVVTNKASKYTKLLKK